jgi:hypothetical protein
MAAAQWFICRGSKVHSCNPVIDEIRASVGAERLPFEYTGTEFDLKWVKCVEHIDWVTFDGTKQLVNYVRGSAMLTEKGNLVRSLRQYSSSRVPAVDVSFHPRTFLLSDANERSELQAALEGGSEESRAARLLIVKPGHGSQGMGIMVHSAATVSEMLRRPPDAAEGLPASFIVQEYISRPLLVEGRKFDLRCYACVVSTHPSLHVVFWPRGYLRQAMTEYTGSDLSDRTAHLTNVTVMKETADFEQQVERAIWDFDRLQAYLTAEKLAPPDFVDTDLKAQMAALMTHCFLSIEKETSNQMGQFQLVGFDLMVDAALKVHLLEVNYNPSLGGGLRGRPSSVLKAVIPPVVREAIGMAMELHTKQRARQADGGAELRPLLPLAAQCLSETLLPAPQPPAPAVMATSHGE